ncbi:SPOR domain-containing protein [Collimonas sp. OK412]|jgi:cell division protein FtsN|uniref:SPOR domain-containing protein n=1 Tax=Collimonas sp. (strain OK412) TaxID=1801619 RepID=UPI0008DFB5B9|nr:SPOR domain-containing protein [Collimonas sp. OK412]SFD32887.1 cell division protein FtsN [Collimonas sp. OK412]
MSKLNKKQAGGTLLGLIFGLIIGLAIAVVVAIMITKTPTPFTNKTAKTEKAPEAITAPAPSNPDQLPDPNKSLYGNKDAAKEAAKAFTPPPPGADGVPPNVAAEKKLDALVAKAQDKSAPVVDKSTADKTKKVAGDIAEAKSKATAADDNWIYFLQVGAFREQSEAESAKARLALMGFEAKISERQADTGSLYRVRVGPFNQLETMNRIRGKLSDNGVNAAVVRAAK